MNGTHDLGLYHASPRDPVWEYVLSGQADQCMQIMQPRVGAVGHSHMALFFHKNDTPHVVGSQSPGEISKLVMDNGRWLISGGVEPSPATATPGGVGPARHRAMDRHLAASRLPHRRGGQGHRRGQPPLPSLGNVSTADSDEKTTSTRKRVLAAVACVALLTAGCGSDDEGKQIAGSAAELQRSLESIERRFDLGGGACQDITQGEDTDVDAVQAKIDALPDDVDKGVRDALQESFDRLFDLVQEECTQTDTDTETETETTPTEQVPTVTEEVPTATETVPTETTPPQTNTPGNQGNGNGNGNGGGNGGGNSNGTGGGGQQAQQGQLMAPTESRAATGSSAGSADGMSTVYQALDTVLERPVAVKLLAEHLAEDEAFVARFRREALAAAKLMHPNVVQVFDSGRDDATDRHYIVMEYVDGPSCADLLREYKQLEVEETVAIVRDACQALDYAHRAGVVHRDVKPGNLLLSNETGTIKLADFGIAKAAEQTRITQVGSVLGTAAYLSPEQARGDEAGPASDIYSLGVCAYQFLAGRLPHEYSSLTELALKQQEESVEPAATYRPELPAELDAAFAWRWPGRPRPATRRRARDGPRARGGFHGHATEPPARSRTAPTARRLRSFRA